MLARCLLKALAGFAFKPRQHLTVSACFFFIAILPGLPLAWAAGWRGGLVALVWVWLWAPALPAACRHVRDRSPWLLPALKQARQRVPESAMSAVLFACIAFAAYLAARFYLRLWPGQLGLALAGAVSAVVLWAALVMVVSLPLSTQGGPWQARWKAACLMPLAYFPSCLAALLVLIFLTGLPALALGLGLRGVSLWGWPAVLVPILNAVLGWPAVVMPVFTPAFGALTLLALLEEMHAHSLGQPPPEAPSFKEIWQPWR